MAKTKGENASPGVEGAKKILIVDDEPGIRFLLEQRLSKMGYRIDVAANGLHALQKLRGGFIPDLVLCDIKMQGMNGVELLGKIKEDSSFQNIPFLIMTGFAEKNLIVEAKNYGVKDLLLKPFANQDLISKIQSMLTKPKVA